MSPSSVHLTGNVTPGEGVRVGAIITREQIAITPLLSVPSESEADKILAELELHKEQVKLAAAKNSQRLTGDPGIS